MTSESFPQAGASATDEFLTRAAYFHQLLIFSIHLSKRAPLSSVSVCSSDSWSLLCVRCVHNTDSPPHPLL